MTTQSASATSGNVKLHALLLAGGGGTRLWPLSRRARPKQFLRSLTASGRSLIAETAARLDPVVPSSRVWVVAAQKYEAEIREHLPQLDPARLVREPIAKNTAPAIALGCAAIALAEPEAVVAVLPSDHAIAKPERLRALLAAAGTLAAERKMLVTMGIVPDRPATGYGYIRKGEALGRVLAGEAFRAAQFREKPDAPTAVKLLQSGEWLWNSGMFVWRAADLLEEIARHLPELGQGLRDWAAASPAKRPAVAERVFAAAPSISIDYAVMEKSSNVAVIPADRGWDDVGTLRSLAAVGADAKGGAMTAKELIAIDAGGNLVHAEGKTVALIGVDDLIVVDTPDALLVAPRERAEDVKRVVEELQRRKRDDVL